MIKKLIEALRSGKYRQGRGWLCISGKYCCLGVACEIYQKEVGGLSIKESPDGSKTYNEERQYPPEEVWQWFKLYSMCGQFESEKLGFTSLAGLNDASYTFEEIADILEEEFCK